MTTIMISEIKVQVKKAVKNNVCLTIKDKWKVIVHILQGRLNLSEIIFLGQIKRMIGISWKINIIKWKQSSQIQSFVTPARKHLIEKKALFLRCVIVEHIQKWEDLLYTWISIFLMVQIWSKCRNFLKIKHKRRKRFTMMILIEAMSLEIRVSKRMSKRKQGGWRWGMVKMSETRWKNWLRHLKGEKIDQ